MNFWDISKIFIVLVGILGGVYFLLYLLKRYMFSGQLSKAQGIKIDVLNTQVITPKKYISVVKVNEKYLILGISDQSINLLDTLENIPEITPEQNKIGIEDKPSFLELLKKNMGIR